MCIAIKVQGSGDRGAGNGKTQGALKVWVGSNLFQAGAPEQVEHRPALVVVMFQEQPAPWRQSIPAPRDDQTQGVEAIASPIERQAWFMRPHDRLQGRPDGRRDVWRVGDDQIETPPPGMQRLPPAALQQLDPGSPATALEIPRSLAERCIAAVHRQALTRWPEACQGHRQAARPGAEIGPAGRRPISPQRLGQLHQQLGLRAGNEHPRSHDQLEIPPGATLEQVLKGFRELEMALPEDGELVEGYRQ